jgi:hypothetical protein
MIGICFKYNPGYKSLLRDQYYELIKAFPGLTIFEREVHEDEPDDYNGQVFTRITDADDLSLDSTLVILTGQDANNIQGTINLKDYVHPENAIYFFGDDQSNLTQEKIGNRVDYDKVYIPIQANVWSAQAIAIVLYDRQSKE